MTIGVNERSAAVKAMLAESQAVADIYAGGDVMRSAGVTYLPRFPVETDDDYQARLESTWLFNGIEKHVDDTTGRIFAKPIVLADKESKLGEWANNIDMEGRDLSNFGKDVFEASLRRGLSFIMADSPPKEAGQARGAVDAIGWRPFLVSLPLEQVLGWKWTNANGYPMLTQFRLSEQVPKADRGDYSDETIEQIRVLDLIDGRVQVTLWQGATKGWDIVEQYLTELDQIYVVPVYTGRTGYMQAKTKLKALAELNLAHWRVQSDKSNCLHKALSPLLHLHNMGAIGKDGESIINSSGYGFLSEGDNASMQWVEVTGSGIAQAGLELNEIKDQMKQAGLQIISERVGITTATGEKSDDGKSVTRIRMWADDLKDSLEIAMGWLCNIAGIEANTDLVVNKDFGLLGDMPLSDVKDMYLAGVISKVTYINEAKRRGAIDEAVIAEDEAEMTESEGLDAEQ